MPCGVCLLQYFKMGRVLAWTTVDDSVQVAIERGANNDKHFANFL